MALSDYLAELDALAAAAASAFQAAAQNEDLEAARVEFLGAKNGRLKAIQKGLSSLSPSDKPAGGKRFNEAKNQVEAEFAAAQTRLAQPVAQQTETSFDVTAPGRPLVLGKLHPITQTIEELKDIMGRLGFSAVDGPEVEDEWHNFEALNIPPSHPARDPLENFYLTTAERTSGAASRDNPQAPLAKPLLLRSQTSTVQIRVMERTPPPVRIISVGRVYRPDDADATHYPMFHQIEGLMVDRGVTMAQLKSVLRLFAAIYFGGEVHIRFRPSFFPFTEPSVEVDMSWGETKDGQATRWVEMGGAGMVDPHVLSAVGYDPDEVTGFAFGLGVERVCARRHGVQDIRDFYRNDVRFLRQF